MPEPNVTQVFKFRNKATGEEHSIPASNRAQAIEILNAQIKEPSPETSQPVGERELADIPMKMAKSGLLGPALISRLILGDKPIQDIQKGYRTRRGFATNVARPVLETGLSALGNIAGMPAGPVGMAAGGTLGFAGGAEAADIADILLGVDKARTISEEAKQTAGRLAIGGILEGTLPVGSRLATWVKGLSRYLPEKQISDLLATIERSTSPAFGPGISGGAISKGIEGMRAAPEDIVYTLAQTSKTPSLAQEGRILARSGTTEPGSTGAAIQDVLAYTRGKNIEAAEKRLLQGEEGTWVDAILGRKEAVETAEREAAEAMGSLTEQIGRKESEAVGESLQAAYSQAEETARKQGGELFEKALLGTETDVSDIHKLAKDIQKGPKGQAPLQSAELNAFIDDAATDPFFTGEDLQGVYRNIGDAIGKAKREGDRALVRRLTPLYTKMNQKLETMGGGEFRTANQWWQENVVEPFVKAPGAGAMEKTSLKPATTGEKFLRSGQEGVRYAQDLKRQIGETEATEAMRRTAGEKLVSKYPDLEPKNVRKWVDQHEYALREYGIYDEMSEIAVASTDAQAAKEALETFQKSKVAVKGLGADDPVVAVKSIFTEGTGPMNQREAVKDAVSMIGDNPEKIAALKRDFSVMLRNEATGGAKIATGEGVETIPEISFTQLKKTLKKYGPAMDELYTTQERASMNEASDIFETLGYGMKEPGSDTAIKLAALDIAQGLGNLLIPMPSPLGAIIARPSATFKHKFKKKADEYLYKVMTDPDFAQTLLDLGLKRSDIEISKRLSQGVKIGTGRTIRIDTPADALQGFFEQAKTRLDLNPDLRKTLQQQLASVGLFEWTQGVINE